MTSLPLQAVSRARPDHGPREVLPSLVFAVGLGMLSSLGPDFITLFSQFREQLFPALPAQVGVGRVSSLA